MNKITIGRKLLEQALEALEYENSWHETFKVRPYVSTIDAITALRAVLAEHQESWEHLMRYGYAPGNYMSRCHNCDKIASGVDKRVITCRPCAEVRHAESQKAEPVHPAIPLENSREAADAIEATLAEYGHPTNPVNAARAGWRAARLYTAPPQPAQPVQEPASKMTAGRAAYFMARFKREEKMLGPNEQAALDFVISMLEGAQAEPMGLKDAPERIWLQAGEDDHCEVPFREHDEITWCAEQQNPLDVPYVRADLAAPPQRKPLTEEEIMQAFDDSVPDYVDVSDAEMIDFARAVERAHEIKE